MNLPAIHVSKLGKQYKIGGAKQHQHIREVLRDIILSPIRNIKNAVTSPNEDQLVWALRNVSFEVYQGEVLGIIGSNGAGKSTLLKLLSRITSPTEGTIGLGGRIASMLEVGTGFHPELTGRENIYLNGTILGMRKKEIDSKFEEIVEFSGVSKFLDTPVKRYSSGMYVRLAFAVAAHLDPEILVIDEVLAVGDAEFQKKCLGKMNEVAKSGRTILFVSHNMRAIAELCTRALLLSSGKLIFEGKVDEAIALHLHQSLGDGKNPVKISDQKIHERSKYNILKSISSYNSSNELCTDFQTGQTLKFRVSCELPKRIKNCRLQFFFHDALGRLIMITSNAYGDGLFDLDGNIEVECELNDNRLISGEYTLGVSILDAFPTMELLDYVPYAMQIYIKIGNYLGGEEMPLHGGAIAQKSSWTKI